MINMYECMMWFLVWFVTHIKKKHKKLEQTYTELYNKHLLFVIKPYIKVNECMLFNLNAHVNTIHFVELEFESWLEQSSTILKLSSYWTLDYQSCLCKNRMIKNKYKKNYKKDKHANNNFKKS